MEQVFVYVLKDPIEDRVRYVGTTNSPQARMREHLAALEADTPKNKWILDLGEAGTRPYMVIICAAPNRAGAEAIESNLIAALRAVGNELYNRDSGCSHTYNEIRFIVERENAKSESETSE